MENEHFMGGTMKNVYGTMDTCDGIVNNAVGIMYMQNQVKLRNLEQYWIDWINL